MNDFQEFPDRKQEALDMLRKLVDGSSPSFQREELEDYIRIIEEGDFPIHFVGPVMAAARERMARGLCKDFVEAFAAAGITDPEEVGAEFKYVQPLEKSDEE
jgi:hypothetical protein